MGKIFRNRMSELMNRAWKALKLQVALKQRVVKFIYQKLNGEVRTAWGTLKPDMIQEPKGTERKKNETLITYFDNEKQAYRSLKIANLIKIEY